MNQRLYTIKLGSRIWETTSLHEYACFIFSFINRGKSKSEPFKVSSVPYSGAEIPTVINVN
jgi:hypothetical protein